MIELKNIKKTYKSKKGLPTEALKGVDISFCDKGLTFILGKSGSGKSTLLNIIGGLDSYTSGDIIVNGKSTKDFNHKEWDAYRNTYIGFVFQDFNLLDNYTVERNIRLALELQHKKSSEQELLDVLHKMDLEDILKRKPNELSGGQKQRVAIARALIKNPEIILLDEPTGNLDSNTSTQIFETLKKLSKEKLVVVVSHDEKSAKKYADRIIEIEDGNIISDNNNKKTKDNNEFKLVNARLPFFYCFKMGLGNLFHKKIRMLFSLTLITLCLICLGIAISTLNYDINEEYYKKFEEKGSTTVSIKKYEKKVVQKDIYLEQLKQEFKGNILEAQDMYPKTVSLTNNFITEIENKTNMKWNVAYRYRNNEQDLAWNIESKNADSLPLYYHYFEFISSSIELVDMDSIDSDAKIIGDLPLSDDEIVITSYMADQIIYNGIEGKTNLKDDKIEKYKPISYNQIINDNIFINLGDYLYVKVVGIIDITDITNQYNEFKDIKFSAFQDMMFEGTDEYKRINKLLFTFLEILSNNSYIYVSDSFISKLSDDSYNLTYTLSKLVYNNKAYETEQFGYLNKDSNVYDGKNLVKKSTLNDNEIVINLSMLNTITDGDYNKKLDSYLMNNELNSLDEFIKDYITKNNIIGKSVKTSVTKDRIYNDDDNFVNYVIVGVVDDKNDLSIVYYSNDIVKNYILDKLYISKIYKKVTNIEDLKTINKYYPIDNSDELSTSYISDNVLSAFQLSILFKIAGKYGSLIFLVFASLILMNFISTSIKYRKKEIGILRAIGCKGIDVTKIFIYECLILAIICSLIAFVIINKCVNMENYYISSSILECTLMSFGLPQMIVILLFVILIVILGCSIPMIKLIRQKPIDTILDK